MSDRLRVGIAEYQIARAPSVLVSYGLGSCLAIALYDPQLRIGALAHTLLGAPHPGQSSASPGKFAETAIRAMCRDLEAAGARHERLIAKLCGGAHMFRAPGEDLQRTIGRRNADAARRQLAAAGIPLAAEDLGGHQGRTVEFDLASGKLLVRLLRGHDKLREL